VWWTDNGEFSPLCNWEINTIADFANLKIRVHEMEVMIKGLQTIGAQPVAMAFPEIYTGLQQGTINGNNATLLTAHTSKFYELCKVYNQMCLFYDMGLTCVATEWLESLPPDLQEVMRTAAQNFSSNYNETYEDELAKSAKWLVEEGGMTVNTYTAAELASFKEAVQPCYDWYRETYGSEKLDKYLASIDEINAKYA